MKKIILVCALICAGQMCGMEPQSIRHLPPELQEGIRRNVSEVFNKVLTTKGATIDERINAIKVESTLRGIRYNTFNDFKRLVQILADKFTVIDPEIARRITMLSNEGLWKPGSVNSYIVLPSPIISENYPNLTRKQEAMIVIAIKLEEAMGLDFTEELYAEFIHENKKGTKS